MLQIHVLRDRYQALFSMKIAHTLPMWSSLSSVKFAWILLIHICSILLFSFSSLGLPITCILILLCQSSLQFSGKYLSFLYFCFILFLWYMVFTFSSFCSLLYSLHFCKWYYVFLQFLFYVSPVPTFGYLIYICEFMVYRILQSQASLSHLILMRLVKYNFLVLLCDSLTVIFLFIIFFKVHI
jgi:hypothetical protein